jgi:predicted peptidase
MVRNCLIVVLLLLLTAPVRAVAPGGIYVKAAALSLTLDDKPLPKEVGYSVVRGWATFHGRKLRFSSGIFLPPAFLNAKQPMPILMALHNRFAIGASGGGEIVGEGMGQLLAYGRPDERAEGDKCANPIALQKGAQFIGLVPQCPLNLTWEDPVMADLLCKFIAQMVTAYHADDDRVYCTGFSYGASSSWRLALNAPDRFAAIICCDGRATPNPAQDVEKLKNVGIYLEVGQWDGDFVQEADWMHQALNHSGHRNYIFHQIPGGNHFNYQQVYLDPEVWKWVYAQHRTHTPADSEVGSTGTK